jgi:hypothetical protein
MTTVHVSTRPKPRPPKGWLGHLAPRPLEPRSGSEDPSRGCRRRVASAAAPNPKVRSVAVRVDQLPPQTRGPGMTTAHVFDTSGTAHDPKVGRRLRSRRRFQLPPRIRRPGAATVHVRDPSRTVRVRRVARRPVRRLGLPRVPKDRSVTVGGASAFRVEPEGSSRSPFASPLPTPREPEGPRNVERVCDPCPPQSEDRLQRVSLAQLASAASEDALAAVHVRTQALTVRPRRCIWCSQASEARLVSDCVRRHRR